MKTKEYRKMNEKELLNKLSNIKMEEMRAHSFIGSTKTKQKKTGVSSKGTSIFKNLRKERAKILTVLQERKR